MRLLTHEASPLMNGAGKIEPLQRLHLDADNREVLEAFLKMFTGLFGSIDDLPRNAAMPEQRLGSISRLLPAVLSLREIVDQIGRPFDTNLHDAARA